MVWRIINDQHTVHVTAKKGLSKAKGRADCTAGAQEMRNYPLKKLKFYLTEENRRFIKFSR